MNRSVLLLLAILVYVTLDLCLPTMPGAFVFEPADSVESTQVSRGRAAVEVVVAPPVANGSFLSALRRVKVTGGSGQTKEIMPHMSPVANCLPRATLDPTPPAEDPH